VSYNAAGKALKHELRARYGLERRFVGVAAGSVGRPRIGVRAACAALTADGPAA